MDLSPLGLSSAIWFLAFRQNTQDRHKFSTKKEIPQVNPFEQETMLRRSSSVSESLLRRCVSPFFCGVLAPLTPTGLRWFDVRDHEKHKRKMRELEKAGIDLSDETPWIAPEEQQRLDAEDEARKAQQEQRLKQLLAEREAQESERRARQKEFRAKQLAMSKKRKDANEELRRAKAASHNEREIVGESAEDPQAAAEENESGSTLR